MPKHSLHEVLVRARNRIQRGWIQGSLVDEGTGRVCAVGALWVEAYDRSPSQIHNLLTTDARTALELNYPELRVLRQELIPQWSSISRFNDTHSQGEVLALFDRMIAATAPAPEDLKLEEPETETVQETKEQEYVCA